MFAFDKKDEDMISTVLSLYLKILVGDRVMDHTHSCIWSVSHGNSRTSRK